VIARAAAIWVLGLVTLVPLAIYHLLFEASRDQYALLIVFVLFWIFGYWGLVGVILTGLKLRSVSRAVRMARSPEELRKAVASPEARDVAIDLIAKDNHVPRFVAAFVLDLLVKQLKQAPPADSAGRPP
jgi:hypothetical protein